MKGRPAKTVPPVHICSIHQEFSHSPNIINTDSLPKFLSQMLAIVCEELNRKNSSSGPINV